MNKQNLWFLTLFSLILILGVYYITMPNDILETIEKTKTETKEVNNEIIEETNSLVAMRVNLQEERLEKVMSKSFKNIYEKLVLKKKPLDEDIKEKKYTTIETDHINDNNIKYLLLHLIYFSNL